MVPGQRRQPEVKLTWRGETHTVTQWAKRVGLDPRTILTRLAAGKQGDAIFRPRLTETTIWAPQRREERYKVDLPSNTMDLTGSQFGKLRVVGQEPIRRLTQKGKVERFWQVQCHCGAVKQVRQSSLVKGVSRSCGGLGCKPHETRKPPIEADHQGEVLTLKAWAARLNIALDTLTARYRLGQRGMELFRAPRRQKVRSDRGVKRPKSPASPV